VEDGQVAAAAEQLVCRRGRRVGGRVLVGVAAAGEAADQAQRPDGVGAPRGQEAVEAARPSTVAVTSRLRVAMVL
jgi:hypothetical protein